MTTISRTIASLGALAAVIATLLPAAPAAAYSNPQRWQWDQEWLQETNGGFLDEYPYDSTMFYNTLPSRSRSFALHPYFRGKYYTFMTPFPPPREFAKEPMNSRETRSCKNYSFLRPNGIPPFGFRCN